MSEGSLVVFGSTGCHVTFTKSDLKMPPFAQLREGHGEAAAHFVQKQWATLCSFWMNRVLKETKLQHLSIDEVIGKILDEALHRYQKKKEEQQLHKKRKRLLENTDPEKGAGIPTRNVLIVNVVDLKTYLKDKPASDALIDAVLEACHMLLSRGGGDPKLTREDEVHASANFTHRVMVDEEGELPQQPTDAAGEPPTTLGPRTEDPVPCAADQLVDVTASNSSTVVDEVKSTAENAFDDRVALVVTCDTVAAAATVIAKLHHRVLEGRALVCRFIGD
jgi:hypothetical protein